MAALADRVPIVDAAGSAREIPIANIRSLAAFGDQIWGASDTTLHQWNLRGQPLGAPTAFAAEIVPTLAGPPAAAAGGWLWTDDRRQPLDGALPLTSRLSVNIERRGGERVARINAAAWTLRPGTEVVAAAPPFDGAAVALFVRIPDGRQACSTASGTLMHRILIPDGDLRLAARRGIVMVRGDELVAIDLRYGRTLDAARALAPDCDDFAIAKATHRSW
jgi:hypothetical protein